MKYSRDAIVNIAFYNVENLFDTIDDPNTNDDKFTPRGERNWTYKRYYRKIKKISYVISQIGKKNSTETPVLVGLAEVENTRVLEDLVNQKSLQNCGYRYVHFDSNDERGIDTALLYRDKFFDPVSTDRMQFSFLDENGSFDHTRDVLLVSGFLNGELVHVIVNHWPSRREGEELSKPKRIKAADVVKEAIDQIASKDPNAKIIIMGDFNDNPTSESVREHLVTDDFFNPMLPLYEGGNGTLTFQKQWYLFDQIILSKNFKEEDTSHRFISATIFNKKWLTTHKGKHKGSPFRTFIGPWYKGGFSDHFPVFVSLSKN
ncbi:endonuclease/exonuclease/phosphatase family protein [Tenacibaculum sp. MEBiC06402]|uniref:endonuclease/exonuclease/phosphatase family protein n=1 Tax=unclassified Tenacibaculum TaxID=2635139 RepID=UPI003B9C9867